MTEPLLPARDVVVLCWGAESTADRRARTIAAFLGADATSVPLTPAALSGGASIRQLVSGCTCLVVDAETVALAVDLAPERLDWLRGLTVDVARHVFVFGFQPTERHVAILRALSSDALVGVETLPDANASFHVADDHREWCGQFSGLSVGQVDAARERHFTLQTGAHRQDTMIRAGDKPFFVQTEHGGAHVFLLACSELADLDERVRRQAPVLAWFSRLVPIMMFLRGALGNRVWHNDHPQACFIIDDPLLKKRHGFLEYGQLVESMRRQRFSTCIAFVPWNYRRSQKEVAALFSTSGLGPSLCVHGCDHTRAEFATTDSEALRGKALLALERMRQHHRLSGVPFDDVMVFPQGLFSVEAIAALKAAGYLAAVNTDLCPSTTAPALSLRDVLSVAVTAFADFPLFGRRYPRDLGEFALDLFVGKPALAVEHHGYFRDGHAALESFVERLNGLDPRLEWTGLGTICSSASVTRTTEAGDVLVRFYTSRFRLTNTGTRVRHYVLLQRHAAAVPLPSVTVDGHERACGRDDDHLAIRLSVAAGQTVSISVAARSADGVGSAWRDTALHGAKVRIRRHLSDFRDNHVATNRVLSAIVATARQLRQGGKVRTALL